MRPIRKRAAVFAAAICVLFFGSGVSALVLEVVWTRLAELVIGNSVQAASTIIAVYMLGLGLGAWGAGRRSYSRPLFVYAALEGAIVLWALAVPGLIGLLQRVLPWLQAGGEGTTPVFWRVLACGLIFLPPTLCMGATLPVLTGVVARDRGSFGTRFGVLYGTNTVGAMAGALLAGFILLPALGISGSTRVAVAVNVGAAVLALLLGRGWTAGKAADEADEEGGAPRRGLVALAAASGFLGLFLEVFWFRVLVLVFGATTYSLSAMLAVFLGGSGLGAFVLGRLGDREKRREPELRAIAWCAFLAGLYIVGSCALIGGLPERYFGSLAASGFSWPNLVRENFWLSLQVILPPAFLLGGILPLSARALRNCAGARSEAVAARVYLFNTVAGALGVLLAGFLVLPQIGLQNGLLVAGGLATALGLAAVGMARVRDWRLLALPVVFVGLAALVVRHPWDLKKFALGAYFGPLSNAANVGTRFDDLLATSELLLFREGVAATIAVVRSHDGSLFYTADGKVEAETSRRSMINQRLIGHLAMLLHPGPPRRVLNIGLGAGVTLGAMGAHSGVERLEVVELEPATASVARYFGPFNHEVMMHPRLRVTFDDARNFLLLHREPFDVISSDPFEPVVAGAIHLFTREHFELVRSRLKDDGIFCQWIPMYELSPADYEALVGTFAAVFPQTLYFTTGSDSILVGFKSGVRVDPVSLERRLREPAVAESLREIGFTEPAQLWGMLVADFSRTPPPVPPRLNTDDDPFVEFSAPRHTLSRTDLANRRMQIDLLEAGRVSREESAFLGAFPAEVRADIERQRLALGWALQAGLTQNPTAALEMVEKGLSLAPRHPLVREEAAIVYHGIGLRAREGGDREEARRWAQRAFEMQPADFSYHYRYAAAAFSSGELPVETREVIERGVAAYPESPYFLSLLAAWYLRSGDPDRAIEYYEAAVERAPKLRFLWEQYAQAVATLRDPAVAERFLERRRVLQGPE